MSGNGNVGRPLMIFAGYSLEDHSTELRADSNDAAAQFHGAQKIP
jgi:hypothetical protein